jgi:hypothetical protein
MGGGIGYLEDIYTPHHQGSSSNLSRSNRSSCFIRNSYILNKLLTFGLGIIILQGVSRRKSLAGVNIMTFPIKI